MEEKQTDHYLDDILEPIINITSDNTKVFNYYELLILRMICNLLFYKFLNNKEQTLKNVFKVIEREISNIEESNDLYTSTKINKDNIIGMMIEEFEEEHSSNVIFCRIWKYINETMYIDTYYEVLKSLENKFLMYANKYPEKYNNKTPLIFKGVENIKERKKLLEVKKSLFNLDNYI